MPWEQFEEIQQTIEQNRQRMEETFARKRAVRRGAALLTGLTRCGLCGHAMRVAYKESRFQYVCNAARTQYGKPSCQYLSGGVIDETVTEEFFRVLRPAEIDALQRVSLKQAEHHQALVHHLEQEVTRLDYEAKRAERQYQCVDPENRLIAATLEKNWEAALQALENAESKLTDTRGTTPSRLSIPEKLRRTLADAGRRLPEVWDRLSIEARKSLLRTLIEGVNLRRRPDGTVQIRIVWRGGLVSERIVRLPVFTLRDTELEAQLVTRIRELVDEGATDDQIADRLNREKYIPCRSPSFTPRIVVKLKRRHGIVSNLERARRGNLRSAYTMREMAGLLGVHPSWIYREISRGKIKIMRDSRYGCYLFPKKSQIVEKMKQLKARKARHASIPKVHHNG
jgi:hypothetical protein